jgi:hypothetical protein
MDEEVLCRLKHEVPTLVTVKEKVVMRFMFFHFRMFPPIYI